MVAIGGRGCHFGDKCASMRGVRQALDESSRSAPGSSAD
jgi:hypothetical protein